LLERSRIVCHVWIFRRHRSDIADFDVAFLYAGPFCARAEEPAPSFEFEHGTSKVQYRMGLMDIEPEISNSENRTSVIDVIAHDPKTGEVVLIMNEPNEWGGSDEQLLSLQERFNAYVSFVLDGEMAEAHPEIAGKPTRIELRCAHIPDTLALELLGHIHDQLAFQEIRLEVVVKDTAG
jgi:hypothetical protein